MRILAISTLFPTPEMPNHGIFVRNRLTAMSAEKDCNISIINPIPTSPLHKLMPRYAKQQAAPLTEDIEGLGRVYRPRYFAAPGVNKAGEHRALIRSATKIAEQLNKGTGGPFDHIDVHWAYPDLPFGLMLAKKWGIPCTVTLRGMETFYLTDKDKRKDIIHNAMTQVDGIISLSDEMLNHAYQNGDKNTPGTVIRNGVDTSRFTHTSQEKARLSLGLDTNAIILLGVGALIERKGFHHILHALSAVRSAFPEKPVHYYVLGAKGMEGDFEKSLNNFIDKNKLRDSAFLYGKVDNANLPTWYNAADVFCLSSFGEGSPNVLTEALSCGCPAVASEVGAVSTIMLSEPDLGEIVPSTEHTGNAEAGERWAKAIIKLLHGDLTDSARKTRSVNMSKYTWEWCAQQALSFIKSVKK